MKAVLGDQLECHPHLQLPAPEHARRLGRRSHPPAAAPSSDSDRNPTTSRPKRSIFTWTATSASGTWCLPARTGRSPGASGTNTRNTSRISTPAARTSAHRLSRYPGGLHLPERSRTTVGPRSPDATRRRSSTHTGSIRSAGPMNCGSRPSRAADFTGSRGCTGRRPWTKTPAELLHAGAAVSSRRISILPNYYQLSKSFAAARSWYAYVERSDQLQTTEFANISFDVTDKLNVEAGTVHYQVLLEVRHTFCPVRLRQLGPERLHERFAQVGQQVRHQLQDHRPRDGVRRFRPGIPRRRQQHRRSTEVLRQRRAATSTRPTRSTISNWAGKRRVSTGTCCGTARPTS